MADSAEIAHVVLLFSSREKMRISPMPVSRRRATAPLPKEPVPPVMSRVFPEKIRMHKLNLREML